MIYIKIEKIIKFFVNLFVPFSVYIVNNVKKGKNELNNLDKEFLNKLKMRDEGAVSEFIDIHRNRIYAIAYRLTGNREDALDITQEVFIKILENIHKLDEKKCINAYINTITMNLSYDYLRSRFKPNWYSEMISFFHKQEPHPIEKLKIDELRNKVYRAINKLSKGERKVIILKYFNNLKINEISTALGVTEGTIKKQLSRAKEKLETILRKELQ